MELFILLLVLAIFVETSFLVSKNRLPKRTGVRKIYVDTSALIDGRIINIAETGFLDGDLIILKSVLRELQLLADGKDAEKRVRARAGLSNVSELERVVNVNTEIFDDGEGNKKVDEELLKFAKENKGAILTIDYNLIKVAEAEKIEALNINDLALAVRTEFLPGEKIQIKITEKGSNRGQGVGHLPDGTMVVVDKAANKIGKNLTVEFVRFHETSAGKMIFAKIAKR
ncbi:TRAM domain-containing protein [Candidatus Saccharibacteria bacterium]|nr:TRAM domain-containing protein [Candidatus Saccharibacteria bacterium]MBR3253118.1 TRAM domain-containing protein [Candidatus Saccharibacteria bacterium]